MVLLSGNPGISVNGDHRLVSETDVVALLE
jgi:phosphopantothenate synthetase